MIKLTILWGEEAVADPELAPCTYEFATQAEVHAFWLGVGEAEGWNKMAVFEGGKIVEKGDIADIAESRLSKK